MAVSHWVLGTLLHQGVTTLTSYLETHPVPNCVVIGAERFRAKNPVKSLDDFGMKTIKVGATTAIVPAKMVQFGDVTGKEPDLYDGLPRNSKVLYLATTLKPSQWKIATGGGIGLKDLDDAQQRVFRSILPETFEWSSSQVDANYRPVKQLGSGKLTPEQILALRLRFSRQLQLNVYLADRPNSYSIEDVPNDVEPGGEMIRHDTNDPGGMLTTYGADLRAIVPTSLKPGDLKISGLTQPVTLPGKTTLAEALRLTSSATQLQIQPEIRIRDLKVSVPGPIPVGEFLNVCAQSVGGTYRKVGDRYLLVQDQVGSGARAILFGDWTSSAWEIVQNRERAWRYNLGDQGILQRVNWDSDSSLAPGDELRDRLVKDPTKPPKPFPSSQLGPEIQKVLKSFVKLSAEANQNFRDDVVDVSATMKYQFVLPNGKRLQNEGYLGHEEFFRRQESTPPVINAPVLPRVKAEAMAGSALLVSVSTASDAKFVLDTAKKYGFTEIWAQTDSKEALEALIATEMPVKLVVRPWTVPYGSPASDLTILGDTGQTVWNRISTSPTWMKTVDMMRNQMYPRNYPYLITGEILSPWDPRAARRLRAAAELAATPKLGGTVVLDSQIHGYEPKNTQMQQGLYSPLVRAMWAFGYTDAARLEFFDQFGLDPVDIVEPALSPGVKLGTSSFPSWNESQPNGYDLADAWARFRSKKSEGLLSAWIKQVPSVTHCDINRQEQAQRPQQLPGVVPIGADGAIPSYNGEFPQTPAGKSFFVVSPKPFDANGDDMVNFIRGVVRSLRETRAVSMVVDLSSLSSDRWAALLGRAIEPGATPAASGGL